MAFKIDKNRRFYALRNKEVESNDSTSERLNLGGAWRRLVLDFKVSATVSGASAGSFRDQFVQRAIDRIELKDASGHNYVVAKGLQMYLLDVYEHERPDGVLKQISGSASNGDYEGHLTVAIDLTDPAGLADEYALNTNLLQSLTLYLKVADFSKLVDDSFDGEITGSVTLDAIAEGFLYQGEMPQKIKLFNSYAEDTASGVKEITFEAPEGKVVSGALIYAVDPITGELKTDVLDELDVKLGGDEIVPTTDFEVARRAELVDSNVNEEVAGALLVKLAPYSHMGVLTDAGRRLELRVKTSGACVVYCYWKCILPVGA